MSYLIDKGKEFIGEITGASEAAESSVAGASISAEAQREALNYLKEVEALPREYREQALTQLGSIYGLGEGDQATAIDQLRQSPIYQSIKGSGAAGEEAIMRHAGATGGLRSGNIQGAMYDYNAQLEQQALEKAMSGLTGMAALPSYAPQIAGGTSAIGQTLGQGEVAAGQARQAGMGMFLSSAIGGGQAAMQQAGPAAFSDRRLKSNIKPLPNNGGHKWYSWTWNKKANDLGLSGESEGVIADEVFEYMPEAVGQKDGFATVNYDMLEVNHA